MRIRTWTRPVVIRRLRSGELQEIVRRTNLQDLRNTWIWVVREESQEEPQISSMGD